MTMKKRALVTILAALVALQATAAPPAPASPLAPVTVPVQPLIARFNASCLVPESEVRGPVAQSPFLAAVAAALIPKATGVVVDWVGQLLKKAGQDKKTVMQALDGPYLYRLLPWNAEKAERALSLMPRMRCLHLVSPRGGTSWSAVVAGTAYSVSAIEDVVEGLGLSRESAPSFFLELAVVVSEDQRYFRLVPVFLRYGSALSGSGTRKEADLVGAITFQVPAAEKPFAAATFALRNLKVGATYTPAAFVGSQGEWMPLQGPSAAAQQARVKAADPNVAEKPREFDPVNVTVGLTETQDGIALLTSLGEAITASKEKISEAAAAALPTDARRATAEAAELVDQNAFVDAMAVVAVRQAALDAAPTDQARAEKKADLIKAKLEANKLALKAGLKLPFAELYDGLR